MLAGPPEAKVAVLFSRCALLYSSPYSWTSLIPDNVLHERHALNAWLQGLDEPAYAAVAGSDKYADNLPDPAHQTAAVCAERLAVFRKLSERPFAKALLARYRPGALLLAADAPAPTRAGPWHLIEACPGWRLWGRKLSADDADERR